MVQCKRWHNEFYNSISGVSSLTTKTENILADLTTISGNASKKKLIKEFCF
jgi:hypothetical protein